LFIYSSQCSFTSLNYLHYLHHINLGKNSIRKNPHIRSRRVFSIYLSRCSSILSSSCYKSQLTPHSKILLEKFHILGVGGFLCTYHTQRSSTSLDYLYQQKSLQFKKISIIKKKSTYSESAGFLNISIAMLINTLAITSQISSLSHSKNSIRKNPHTQSRHDGP
jgi:hypothetical protein